MKTALLVVDVQNDFTEGGSLPVAGGAEVAAGITAFLRDNHRRFAEVVASRDWHTPNSSDGGHFPPLGRSPDYRHTWPLHCLEFSHGADFHPALDTTLIDVEVKKGIGVPAYSAFQGSTGNGIALDGVLRAHDISDLVVCGLATDYCVHQTVMDARSRRYPVTVLLDLCAGVAPDTTQQAVTEMRGAGAVVSASPEFISAGASAPRGPSADA